MRLIACALIVEWELRKPIGLYWSKKQPRPPPPHTPPPPPPPLLAMRAILSEGLTIV